jgi:plasmid stabilization system protein ParE
MSQREPKRIRWLNAAVEDLETIVEHIAADAPLAAERFAESILAKVEMLADLPRLGSVCPHYRKARQLIHGSYLVY